MAKKRAATKRTLVDPTRGGKRYVRRASDGTFKEQDAVGRSLTRDTATRAKTASKKGQGDRGDRKTR
jgi:hypothetical protein